MILTADVGNTNITLGGFKDGKFVFVSRVFTQKDKTSDEYAIILNSIFHLYGIKNNTFEGAVISSVVPLVTLALKNAISKLLGCNVLVVSPGIKTGLNIKIDNPSILGSDLVCSAVGAIANYPLPCVIVDLGTATKVSAISADGAFLGVSISPGVEISLNALNKNTAQLPQIGLDGTPNLIGTNSVDSMRSGIIYGTASMIDGMLVRFSKALGEVKTVVATGGISRFIIPHCQSEIIENENLVLEGLVEVYRKNTFV